MRETDPLRLQLFAAPLGLAVAALCYYGWQRLGAFSRLNFQTHHLVRDAVLFMVLYPLAFAAVIVAHEWLHAVAYPGFGRGPATVLGVWMDKLVIYAFHDGAMRRDHLFMVFLMPFLVLTVLPLALAAVLPLPTALLPVAAWFSVWNALFACLDYVGAALLVVQVPRAALVRNQGWRTYWKPA